MAREILASIRARFALSLLASLVVPLAHAPSRRSEPLRSFRRDFALALSGQSVYGLLPRRQVSDQRRHHDIRCSRISGLVVEPSAPGHDGQSLDQGPIESSTSSVIGLGGLTWHARGAGAIVITRLAPQTASGGSSTRPRSGGR